MTEEHKRKIQEGRKRARLEKIAKGLPVKSSHRKMNNSIKLINDKPILIYDNTEKTAFDFWPKIRNVLRPMFQYDLCKKIEREIVSNLTWKNIEIIKEILSKYFVLQFQEKQRKIKKERKKSSYVMTEEHKRKIQEARKKK